MPIVGTEDNDVLVGTADNDVLIGGGGNDSLDGRGGADSMDGGPGDDLFYVNDAGDQAIEDENEGTDTVIASISYVLQAHFERLTLAGGASSGTGNALANLLIGTVRANRLDGGTGADVLRGGEGNDVYTVDDFGDRVEEVAGQGTDTVLASVTYTLSGAVENLTLTGSAGIGGTGNGSANVLIGNAGNNSLDGMAGADVMKGGAGDDIYYVDHAGDVAQDAFNQGIDTVIASVTYALQTGIENLTLTGSAPINGTGTPYANTLTGNASANRLDGLGGADLMIGGKGSDTYVVNHAGDRAIEQAGEGYDIVLSSVSHLLGDNVEALTLTGAAAVDGTGNALVNSLIGNGANNRLDGGGGIDTLRGGAGNDTYVVDSVADKVVENEGEGTDSVLSSVSHNLRPNVEHLTLTGSAAIGGTGNGLANRLVGNGGNNRLDGGAGADELRGGGGDDSYYLDNAGDLAIENAGQGVDTVYASLSHILGANVERLVLTGSAALSATGNALDNRLTGNAAANILDGRAGADEMRGGAGDDVYHVDDGGDRAVELAGQGVDTVISSVGHTLGAHVERLTLAGSAAIAGTGNDLANRILGNAAANTLDGRAGADELRGGAGDDLYLVDNEGDQVIETVGAGSDTVRTSTSYALAVDSHVETLSAAAQAAVTAMDLAGSAIANALNGNAGQNLLDGKGGSDTLRGFGGADTFAFTTALGTGNVDTIADFDPAADRIALSGEVFAGLATGPLASSWFVAGPAAGNAFQRIVYNPATGALLFDADGAGSGAAVQFATLPGAPQLKPGNFVVTGAANGLPVVTSGGTASVAENAEAATIVYDAAASDPDGDALSFFLSGPDAALFAIDAVTGEVRLKQPADYEQDNSFSITVGVADSTGAVNSSGGTRAAQIIVTDVADNRATPLIAETAAANDRKPDAQEIGRSTLVQADNTDLVNDAFPSATIQGSIASPTDQDFFRIWLEAGEMLILDVDGSGGGLDSLVRVWDLGVAPLSENDDGRLDAGSAPHPNFENASLDSMVRFQASHAAYHYFSIEAFEQGSTGTWNLHVSIGPPGSGNVIDEENIDALISSSRWPGTSLTYGFPTSASDYPAGSHDGEPSDNFGAFNAAQQGAVRQILAQISQLTALGFTEQASSPGAAQLRYAMSDRPEGAYAYYPGSGALSGSSWYNHSSGAYSRPALGNYAWLTLIHETGHALGLKHGHEAPALSFDRDSLEYSVMTYRSYVGAPTGGNSGFTNETYGYPQSPMMYDIAALQRIYGPDFTFNGGNTVYGWSDTTGQMFVNGIGQAVPGANRVFLTVWDGGGIDTYDLSNYTTPAAIDLRPGEWTLTSSIQLANLGDGNSARSNVANALLYDDDPRSLIENAVGGSSSDYLIPNQAANVLTGGPGRDTFRWASSGDAGLGAFADLVTDFDSQEDGLDFATIDANPATPADDAFTFIGTDAFTHQPGQMRYEVSVGNAHIFADLNGDGLADMQIVLNDVTFLGGALFNF